MKSKKFLIVILIIGVCMLLTGCKLVDHKQREEITDAGYVYEAVLDFNGGRASNYDYIKYACKSGTKIKEPDTMYPTLTGYEIIGWYVKPSADSDVADIDSWETWDFSTDTVTDNITLVARWRRLRSFSFGYYDNIVPEGGGDAVKTWVELRSVNKSIDGTEFICGNITESNYSNMNSKLTDKTLLSGFNSEQPFYADEALTQEIALSSLVHPVTSEEDLDSNQENATYRIYCEYLEGIWTILDSSKQVTLGNANYYLLGDITLQTSQMYVDSDFNREECTVSNPTLRFTGTIKGNGHKIIFEKRLQPIYQHQSTLFIGFFGVLDGATIEDVTFEGIDFSLALLSGTNPSIRFGFLAGNIINSTLKNVTVNGSLTIENTEGNNNVNQLISDELWFGQKDDATVVDGCNFNIDVDDKRPSNS